MTILSKGDLQKSGEKQVQDSCGGAPNENMPLVSIVVPVYNRAEVLFRSIGSLISQSYRYIEIIVVDDCSEDSPQVTIDQIGDPRVKLVRREVNGGAGAARNTGVEASKGDYISFHDSDDICLFDKIERQVACLRAAPPDFIGVFSSVLFYADVTRETYSHMRTYVRPFTNEQPLFGDLSAATLERNPFNLPTLMIRREAFFSAKGFDPILKNNVDWDFAIRLSRVGKLDFIPEPMYFAKFKSRAPVEAQRISRSAVYSARSYIRIARKVRLLGASEPVLAKHYSVASSFLCRIGRYRSARKFALAALRRHPGSPRLAVRAVLLASPRLFRLVSGLSGRLRRAS